MDDFTSYEEFLDSLNNMHKPKARMINPKRIADLKFTCHALSQIVLKISPDAKITCGLHSKGGSGVLRIETEELIVENVNVFIKAVERADHFEIFPLINGKIRMALIFNDCLINIEGFSGAT